MIFKLERPVTFVKLTLFELHKNKDLAGSYQPIFINHHLIENNTMYEM